MGQTSHLTLPHYKLSTSPRVILDYLGYLTEACFVTRVPRYDIKGKRLFEVNEKYYFGDLGLRNAVIGYKPEDIGKVLENVVYHHLRARGYSVTVGILGGAEIDFVANKGGNVQYFQVAYLLPDEQVIAREFGNLAAIPDHYPKVVISLDPMAQGNRDGIRHVHLRDFLAGG